MPRETTQCNQRASVQEIQFFEQALDQRCVRNKVYKGNNFTDFLFTFLSSKVLWKWVYSLRKEYALLFLSWFPIGYEGNKEYCIVASGECVLFHLKNIFCNLRTVQVFLSLWCLVWPPCEVLLVWIPTDELPAYIFWYHCLSETPSKYRISSVIKQIIFLSKQSQRSRSIKTDLDLWYCLGRVKLVLKQNFIRLI